MVSDFDFAYEDHEAFYSAYAFPVWAHLGDVNFIFFAYRDWKVSSAAFVLGVSWASFLWTDRVFSPISIIIVWFPSA
jgi:hypothetical protein